MNFHNLHKKFFFPGLCTRSTHENMLQPTVLPAAQLVSCGETVARINALLNQGTFPGILQVCAAITKSWYAAKQRYVLPLLKHTNVHCPLTTPSFGTLWPMFFHNRETAEKVCITYQ